jgi:hypothetical protein
MKQELTGVIGIVLGIYFYFIRDKLADMFVDKQKNADRIHGKLKLDYSSEEKYAGKVVLFMAIFAFIVGVLVLLGVLQAR